MMILEVFFYSTSCKHHRDDFITTQIFFLDFPIENFRTMRPPKRSPTYEIDESKNIDVGTIHNWICHTTACIQFNIARNYIQTVKTRLILQRSNSLVMTQTTQKQCKFPFLPSFVVVSVPIPVGDDCRFCRRL